MSDSNTPDGLDEMLEMLLGENGKRGYTAYKKLQARIDEDIDWMSDANLGPAEAIAFVEMLEREVHIAVLAVLDDQAQAASGNAEQVVEVLRRKYGQEADHDPAVPVD